VCATLTKGTEFQCEFVHILIISHCVPSIIYTSQFSHQLYSAPVRVCTEDNRVNYYSFILKIIYAQYQCVFVYVSSCNHNQSGCSLEILTSLAKNKSLSIALLRLKNDAPTVTLKILTKIITPVYGQLFSVFLVKFQIYLKLFVQKFITLVIQQIFSQYSRLLFSSGLSMKNRKLRFTQS
jgi:hypothetical protein